MDADKRGTALRAQRNEITEERVYEKLAAAVRDAQHAALLRQMARQEREHYALWRKITGRDVRASGAKIWWYTTITRLFGLNFGLRLMERGEHAAQATVNELKAEYPDVIQLIAEEQEHEERILGMIDEGALRYTSSIVLGLSDALVELTGALAGLTLALQRTPLIAMVGLIIGFAASLSMGASEYLSTKEEARARALPAGAATGASYLAAVALLITPYVLFQNPFLALGSTLATGITIVLVFTFYTSIAKKQPFRRRFAEMTVITLGVALLNFLIGYAIKRVFSLEV